MCDKNVYTSRSNMFSSVIQPPVLSLFSSSATYPLERPFFDVKTDLDLRDDSIVCLLDDKTSEPKPPSPAALLVPHADFSAVIHRTLHIQSPTIRKTYLRCPSSTFDRGLGITLPWLHLQVRNLEREWSFEVGLVDRRGREGRVRWSTFQVSVTSWIAGSLGWCSSAWLL